MTDLQRSLDQVVKAWVAQQFNFIQLEVVNGFCQSTNQELFEYIRNKSVRDSIEDWLCDINDTDIVQEFLEQSDDLNGVDIDTYINAEGGVKTSFVEAFGGEKWTEFVDFLLADKENDIQEYIYDQENYPLWNTLFEYRDEPSEEELQTALNLNMGVIEGLDPFNPTLFMTSGGHSFYASYWIPMYLSRFTDERAKYAGVDYSML